MIRINYRQILILHPGPISKVAYLQYYIWLFLLYQAIKPLKLAMQITQYYDLHH
jgi:hypothetical protein